MTAKTRAKPSLHRDSFVAPLARGTRTLPGAVVGLRLLKHTAGPLGFMSYKNHNPAQGKIPLEYLHNVT